MDLRLRHLQQLDSRAVPLPHGTEVMTRVDRMFEERRIPQGTIGRVAKVSGGAVDVTVVGVGVLRYARDELTPRRIGQARYAHRRQEVWDALRPCVVIETVVGSRAWGLADETSDEDRRGAFALPLPWTLGLVGAPEDLVCIDA